MRVQAPERNGSQAGPREHFPNEAPFTPLVLQGIRHSLALAAAVLQENRRAHGQTPSKSLKVKIFHDLS
jgi:hypothetical protein